MPRAGSARRLRRPPHAHDTCDTRCCHPLPGPLPSQAHRLRAGRCRPLGRLGGRHSCTGRSCSQYPRRSVGMPGSSRYTLAKCSTGCSQMPRAGNARGLQLPPHAHDTCDTRCCHPLPGLWPSQRPPTMVIEHRHRDTPSGSQIPPTMAVTHCCDSSARKRCSTRRMVRHQALRKIPRRCTAAAPLQNAGDPCICRGRPR